MQIEILFFGQLIEITGCNNMQMENLFSVNQIKEQVLSKFSALREAKFIIALNNKVVIEDQTVPNNSIIAFMPPFSGG